MENSLGEGVVRLPVGSIVPGALQPRKEFKATELQELAESIRVHGIIQPVIVRPSGDNYQLVAGERRWRAAKMAGLAEVPALIRPMADQEAALVALIENVQREDLTFLEEAEAYERILRVCGFTQQELAGKLGRSQAAIANKLRLLRLSAEIRDVISREMISERHARALLLLPRSELQSRVLKEIVSRKLTVRQTELLVDKVLREASEEGRRGARVKSVVRDFRIFLNGFRQTAAALVSAGIQAEIVENDLEETYEFIVRVSKRSAHRPSAREGGR